jgi:hypothetical protein
MAKTHGGSTPARTEMPRPATGRTPQLPAADEKKGARDKEIPVDPSDADKKLHVNIELEAK